MDRLTVVKIGGQVIDDTVKLAHVLSGFLKLEGIKLLVHGGGKKASEMSVRLGVKPRLVEGRRITDEESLEVVTMVYGGLVNKTIVAQLQSLGENAIGLSGADANVIPAHKRAHASIDYGYVGDFDVKDINTAFIKTILHQDITPVFCALTHDGKGSMLNTNADTLAAGIALSLADAFDVTLIYCFEKAGVLLDIDDESSLLEQLSFSHYQQLKRSGAITDGMIPKLDNAFNASKGGVNVTIKDALNLNEDIGTALTS